MKDDWPSWLIAAPAVVALGYVVYLFVTVVFGGESSACPQNLC